MEMPYGGETLRKLANCPVLTGETDMLNHGFEKRADWGNARHVPSQHEIQDDAENAASTTRDDTHEFCLGAVTTVAMLKDTTYTRKRLGSYRPGKGRHWLRKPTCSSPPA